MNRFIIQLFCVVLFPVSFLFAQEQSLEEIPDTISANQSFDSTDLQSATNDVEEKQPEPAKTQIPFKRFGFGISITERIFYPQEINDLSKDIYNEMKSGYIVLSEMGSSDIFMAYSLGAHFSISPIPYLNIAPYGDILWSPKFMVIGSNSENIHLLCYTGGVNVVGVVAPKNRVTFKGGAGLSYGSSNLYVSGDLGDVTMSGSVFGVNLIAGININLNKVTINIDFMVPVQTADFTSRTGRLDDDSSDPYGTTYRYPKSANLTGFEIHEGVTFNF